MSTKNKAKSKKPEIIVNANLRSYFYEELMRVNNKSLSPLPEAAIYYSSDVLERCSDSKQYFEYVEGKVKEKTLGLKLLECAEFKAEEKKRTLKDIGDTALCLCGYFTDSFNKKLFDVTYYQKLGKTAYKRLNTIIPTCYNIPSFYELLSGSFESMTFLISIVAKKSMDNKEILKKYDKWLETRSVKIKHELMVSGVLINDNEKGKTKAS